MDLNPLNLLVGFILGIASSLVATYIWELPFVKGTTPWSGWQRRAFKPGMQGAKDVDHLIKLLVEMHAWLSSNDTQLVRKVREGLWTALTYLSIEKLSYQAIYSQNIDQQVLALRKLSEIDYNEAREAIQGIIHNQFTLEAVRSFATHLLTEIDQRKQSQGEARADGS